MWRDTYDPACGGNVVYEGPPPEGHVLVHGGYLEMHDLLWSPNAKIWRPVEMPQVVAGYPVKDFFAVARPLFADAESPEALNDYEIVSRLLPAKCEVFRVIDRAKLYAKTWADFKPTLVEHMRMVMCIDRITDDQIINFAAVFADRERKFGRKYD